MELGDHLPEALTGGQLTQHDHSNNTSHLRKKEEEKERSLIWLLVALYLAMSLNRPLAINLPTRCEELILPRLASTTAALN